MSAEFDLLKQAIRIDSVYPKEQKAVLFWERVLTEHGFEVERQVIDETGRANLLAKKDCGKRSVLFYGHMDTVPVVMREQWESDPFEPVVKEECLYGLGASDMKGGISAFVEATRDTDASVKVLLAVDEENISEGAWKAVRERSDFFGDVDLIISAEPSLGLGMNGISVGRTGRCIYEVEFIGRPDHIIKYKEAIDALRKLSDFGSTLYAKRESMFDSRHTVAQLRKVEGESKGMSVCREARAEIEVIMGSEDSVEGVLEKLQKLTENKVGVKPRKTPHLQGYYFDSFPYQRKIFEIVKRHTGKGVTLHLRKSVGDDNVLATLKIPIITWGPEGDNEHRPNEYKTLESLRILRSMYKELLDLISKAQ